MPLPKSSVCRSATTRMPPAVPGMAPCCSTRNCSAADPTNRAGIKKGSLGCLFLMLRNPQGLQGNNVLRLRTLLALSYGELNLLTFGQGLETRALDGAVVNKYVRAAFTSDKPKPFASLKNLTVPVTVDIRKLPEINHFICCHTPFWCWSACYGKTELAGSKTGRHY